MYTVNKVHLYLYLYLLYNNQYGFRRKHSTIDVITQLMTDATLSLDEKQSALSVFLDLSKAFDALNHKGTALDWFKSYL